MNITPQFRTSKEWKKFKRSIGHPAAMEFFVNIGCEMEGITRGTKQDNGFINTKDPEDFAYMCGAEDFDVQGEDLIKAFLFSGLMIEEDEQYRLIGWEEQNPNLLASRRNGRKGGRSNIGTEGNETEPKGNINNNQNLKGNVNSNENHKGNISETIKATEPNLTEHNVTERNVTGGLPHANLQVTQTQPTGNPGPTQTEPTGNPGLADDDPWGENPPF